MNLIFKLIRLSVNKLTQFNNWIKFYKERTVEIDKKGHDEDQAEQCQGGKDAGCAG